MAGLTGHSDIDRVRDATDLAQLIGEHIPLKRSGREFVGLCPFHDDHRPSFHVITHKGPGFYKCFSCGVAGDAFRFVQNYLRKDFAEALRLLADRAGIALTPRGADRSADQRSSRAELRDVTGRAAAFFQRNLADEKLGAAARDVIAARRISDDMTRQFMLGCAPDAWDSLDGILRKKPQLQALAAAAGLLKRRSEDSGAGFYDAFRNRVVFPICDESGHPIAFGGRIINPDDQPKYLNSSESDIFSKSKTLYGLHLARRSIIDTKTAVVVEGYIDVIACHQFNITNVVGTLGTALTHDHARVLSRLCDTVVLVFDPDEAGRRAADRAMEVFFQSPIDVRIATLPGGLDPDELLHSENGPQRWSDALAAAPDALAHRVDRLRGVMQGIESVAGRQNALSQFLANLSELGFNRLEGLRKRDALSRLSSALGLSIDELQRAIPNRPPRGAGPGTPALRAGSGTAAGTPALRAGPGTAALRAAAESDHDDSSPDLESIDVAFVPPARRRAEHDLLGLLIHRPDLARQDIRLGDAPPSAAIDVVRTFEFADRAAAAIARAMLSSLEEMQSQISVPGLMDAVEADGVSPDVVASLHVHAEERMQSDSNLSAEQWLASSLAALAGQLSHEEYRRQMSDLRAGGGEAHQGAAALLAAIDHRRKVGPLIAAIPQGVRS